MSPSHTPAPELANEREAILAALRHAGLGYAGSTRIADLIESHLARVRPAAPEQPAQAKADAMESIARIESCLGFLRSVVQSGERWSETCEKSYQEAKADCRVIDKTLATPPAPPPQVEVKAERPTTGLIDAVRNLIPILRAFNSYNPGDWIHHLSILEGELRKIDDGLFSPLQRVEAEHPAMAVLRELVEILENRASPIASTAEIYAWEGRLESATHKARALLAGSGGVKP